MPLTIQDLQDRVLRTNNVFTALLSNYNSLSQDAKNQLCTGINKSYGQAEAFLMEYLTYAKQKNKGREVITQDYADVTSGKADAPFAKSIECKSITDASPDAVNSQIKKAIKQLAGLTGHQPRDNDVRVIDVKVNSKYNSWPNAGGSYGKARSCMDPEIFKRNTIGKLKSILETKNLDGVLDLLNWLNGQDTTNMAKIAPLRNFDPQQRPNSTRPVMKTMTGQLYKVRCLTIKVRFEPMYPSDVYGLEGINEIVVQVYKNNAGTGLTIQTVKLKRYAINSQSFKSELIREY